MSVGSLFSGVGGLELGLERAGLGPVLWQAESDATAREVLAAHWPEARRYTDVRSVTREADRVDLLCGGFPCQDLSSANVTGRARLDGARSGLWCEFARVVGELQPRWVVVENVGKVWRDWVPTVRGDLAGLGYASVPLAVSASDAGAPHHRDRIFVVAHADGDGERVRAVHAEVAGLRAAPAGARGRHRRACAAAVARTDGLPAGLARLPGNAVHVGAAEVIGRAIASVLQAKNPAPLSAAGGWHGEGGLDMQSDSSRRAPMALQETVTR